jgi:hypothetical protein
MNNPAVFIGASHQGIDFARAIGSQLAADAEITVSTEAFVPRRQIAGETLVDSLSGFDFAVLALTPDDFVNGGESGMLGLRDSVLFEIGAFAGRLGKNRTFVVHQANAAVRLPNELQDVTTTGYEWPRPDGDRQTAVGPASESIRATIRDLGFAEAKLDQQIQSMLREQKRQRAQIDDISYLLVHFVSQYEWQHLRSLDGDGDFPFEMDPVFEKEIERLWELHFITKTHDFPIHHMPRVGDLRDYFAISDKGRTYLKLREGYVPDEWGDVTQASA